MECNNITRGHTLNVAIMFHFPPKTLLWTFKNVHLKHWFKANVGVLAKPFHTRGDLSGKNTLRPPRPHAHTPAVRYPPKYDTKALSAAASDAVI